MTTRIHDQTREGTVNREKEKAYPHLTRGDHNISQIVSRQQYKNLIHMYEHKEHLQ